MPDAKRTPLAERHEKLGARMVDFAGWYMPIQYRGIVEEHRAVRSAAGLFDLGHMGQLDVRGPDAMEFLQYVATNDVSKLDPGEAQYALLLYPDGGVVDDILIYRRPDGDGYFVVINAANTDKDIDWLKTQAAARSDLTFSLQDVSAEIGMLAIQGPNSEAILRQVTDIDLSTVGNFESVEGNVVGVPCLVARTGYTGEDGFEIYCPIDQTGLIWDTLMEKGADHGLQAIGLGARDTLRLEAKMPLYGNEMSDTITPLEAGLGFAVKLDKGDFIGREALVKQKEAGLTRRLVGFKMIERSGAPRTHYEVAVDGKTIGFVTSGTASPSLGANIGMALIERSYAGVGKPLDIMIRGKATKAEQIRTPFYKRPEK